MKIVNSWNDFDPLKHVIVGRADNCCIAPSEPASKAKVPLNSPMRGRVLEIPLKKQMPNWIIWLRYLKAEV